MGGRVKRELKQVPCEENGLTAKRRVKRQRRSEGEQARSECRDIAPGPGAFALEERSAQDDVLAVPASQLRIFQDFVSQLGHGMEAEWPPSQRELAAAWVRGDGN